MLTDIGKGQNIAHILGVGLGVYHVNLNPGDASSRIHHRQTPHRIVVSLAEITRQEIVAVGLVVVGPDIKLLSLGTALYFDFLSLSLLLTEDRGVVNLSPLGLELQTKQGLAALNEGALQGHIDVARFNVLQDVVLFSLKPDVHLVLKVERRLGVVVRSEVDFLANASVNGQLNALVEVKCGNGPVALGKPRVLRLAVAQTEIELS